MKKNLTKFVLLFLALGVGLILTSKAQGKTCDLQLNVFKAQDNSAVENASAKLTVLENGKDFKSKLNNQLPFFTKLETNKYRVTVSQKGFKDTVKLINLDCENAVNNLVSEKILLWEGSSKETIHYIENNFENDVLVNFQNLLLNDFATEVSQPEYPKAAMAIKAGGKVPVEIVVDEQGSVVFAKAIGGHPLLKSSAEKAAKKSKFIITLFNDKPVKIKGIVIYNFNRI